MHASHTVFAALIAAMTVALPTAQAGAVADARHQLGTAPRGWSAVEGSDAATLASHVDDYKAGDQAEPGEPYCDAAPTITETLSHDFGEALVSDTKLGADVTQLWGSDVMGTWTLVVARQDDLSCVIASGIGYTSGANPDLFFAQAGLIS